MIPSRNALRLALTHYQTSYAAEQRFIPQFLSLIESNEAYLRTHVPGHITASAWIIDASREYVLLTHHAKLNKWLQPGGHADGDEDVLRVALREAEEETGVKNFTLLHAGIFDLDIHPIPERKDFVAHDHYDIRFLLQADRDEPLVITEESHDLAWVKIKELAAYNDSPSLQRMAEKVRSLL